MSMTTEDALTLCSKTAELMRSEARLKAALEALMEFWDNGSPVHPGAEVVQDARDAIAQATE